MTHLQKLCLLFAFTSPTVSFAAGVPKTILPDNVITCQVNANCTNKTLNGRLYQVINTPRFTVMVAVSQEGPYTRADVSIANNTIRSQALTPEDFRVEVVTPKPKVLLYVHPSDLKDLPADPVSSPTPQLASSPQPSQAPSAADPGQSADRIASQHDLSATSLPPNEVTRGRVFFERDKHAQLINVVLPIAGLVFEFPYIMK
jgi:hypothetical protein